MSKFGRYQVAEPPAALLRTHVHDEAVPLKEVDWEPKVGVLDQEDLMKQDIHVTQFIPGAGSDVDALGSCTANATTAKLSSILSEQDFTAYINAMCGETPSDPYGDTVTAEKAAIGFYYRCTHQTGDPSEEWPPTDCGSSGLYCYDETNRLGYVQSELIAHGATNIVSLLQQGALIVGQPFLNAWMQPGADGFIDGDGSAATLEQQLKEGVAGGHETVLSAVEQLELLPSGQVDPTNTIIRFRNSWTKNWGDNGSYRAHLSTYVALGAHCDFRLLMA